MSVKVLPKGRDAPLTDYVVRTGDTFNSIARMFNIPFAHLLSANPHITDPDSIVAGQTIHFPAGYPVKRSIYVNGYVFPNIDHQTLADTLYYLTYLSIFSYEVRPDGTLSGLDDERIIHTARQAQVAPIMVITNIEAGGSFSSTLAHTILTDTLVQQTLLNNVVSILKSKNYYGLNIYFQYLYPADRTVYAQFLQLASERLRPLGYIVATAVAPKEREEKRGLPYEAHEYPVHGKHANHVIVIMSFDWGYTYGFHLAVAPIDQIKHVLDYAVSAIPSQNILLGMPNYSFDWTLYHPGAAARTLSSVQAEELAAREGAIVQFDPQSQMPYFNYHDEMDVRHVVWYDDERSIRARLELVERYNLGGVSYWTINEFSPVSYIMLNAMYEIRKVI